LKIRHVISGDTKVVDVLRDVDNSKTFHILETGEKIIIKKKEVKK